MLVLGAALYYVLILVVLLVLGIAPFLLVRMRFRNLWILGAAYGFLLGIFASLGYGVDFSPRNLLFGVGTFGIAGIATALTFLYFSTGTERS
jgi:hypothetical protein